MRIDRPRPSQGARPRRRPKEIGPLGRAHGRAHLDDFVGSYRAGERHLRGESERFRPFAYEEFIKRDRLNLHIFSLRDESLEDGFSLRDENLEDGANLPPPEVIAAEIVENLEPALEQFRQVASSLGSDVEGEAAD